MALLKVNEITKVFGGLIAVEDVSFEVNQGGDRQYHRPQRRR